MTALTHNSGKYNRQMPSTRANSLDLLRRTATAHTLLINIACTVLTWILLRAYSDFQDHNSASSAHHTRAASYSEATSANVVPLVISTWGVGEFVGAGRTGLNALRDHKHRLDVVEAMCRYCEEKQCDGSVGYGSHPDTDGHVTLDALIMDGPGVRVGSVGALYGVRNAVGVARAVMEHTRHSLLVGSGARRFARMMGFEKNSTETSASTAQFLDWLDHSCQPNFYTNMQGDAQKWSCGPYTPNRPSDSHLESSVGFVATDPPTTLEISKPRTDVEAFGHDTIAAITVDAEGHLACATTTNGARNKVAGRVGDSPIAGSGCYVEEGAGAAGATGDGDIMMRFMPSFQAVQSMKNGVAPTEACERALRAIGLVYPDFSGGMICVNTNGVIGAASHNMDFQYTTATIDDDNPIVVGVLPLSTQEDFEEHT